jgi:diguanylate cyclase (GGDEF)-like protein
MKFSIDSGGIFIADEATDEIVYTDTVVEEQYGPDLKGKKAMDVLPWEKVPSWPKLVSGEIRKWEYFDAARNICFLLQQGAFEMDGKAYKIGRMTDTSEYVNLSREIASYSAFFQKVAAFQAAALEQLNTGISHLLPVIAEYMETSNIYFIFEKKECLELTAYNHPSGHSFTESIPCTAILKGMLEEEFPQTLQHGPLSPMMADIIHKSGGNDKNLYKNFCPGCINGKRYAYYIESCARRSSVDTKAITDTIGICTENCIMHEQIIYENEHDNLTGLYNKGKFMRRLSGEYTQLKSAGILSLDVNNLKKVNDASGHEAGDRLLIKAADSIHRITSANVHGYRIGGDEYLIIACNCSESDMLALKMRWEVALEELNRQNDELYCDMALGSAYASGNINFTELMNLADVHMYRDKRYKKSAP